MHSIVSALFFSKFMLEHSQYSLFFVENSEKIMYNNENAFVINKGG